MLTVPAEEVKTMRRTVPASLQARRMLIIPSTVGLITSFCNGNHMYVCTYMQVHEMTNVDLCSQSQKTDRTSGSLDSKSMGVATWKTPVQPLMASSKLPSSAMSAFHRDRRSGAPGRSSNGFVFSTFAGGHDTERIKVWLLLRMELDALRRRRRTRQCNSPGSRTVARTV